MPLKRIMARQHIAVTLRAIIGYAGLRLRLRATLQRYELMVTRYYEPLRYYALRHYC